MSNLSMDIHSVSSIVSKRKQLNGQWQRRITITCEDGSRLDFALYTRTSEQASVIEQPDEYVRIEDYEPAIERSAVPFSAPPSAGSTPLE